VSTPIFRFTNYSLSLQNAEILKNINLQVSEGECVSIVGPNGAGKSSLLKSLIKIVEGGSGEILLSEKSLQKISQIEVARKVGYVPQGVNLSFPVSVYDFILMGRYAHLGAFRPVREIDRSAVDELARLLHLSDFLERDMNTLSGGEMQRVLLAGALVQKPALLLLDEPTTFLDPRHSEEVYKIIGSLRDQYAVSIVFVTHDINRGALFTRRIIAMKDGAILFDGEPEDLMQHEMLKKVFDADFNLLSHPNRKINIIIPD